MSKEPKKSSKPLAAILRPQTWEALEGIPELENPESHLHYMRASRNPSSCILYGPPGCGKTTIARILARIQKNRKGSVHSGHGGQITKKDLDTILAENKKAQQKEDELDFQGEQPAPLLFLDEIHRLTRVQSEFLLQSTEEGELILVGATTENPYISLGPALLSRCPVIQLRSYTPQATACILQRSFDRAQELGIPGTEKPFTTETLSEIGRIAGGDARTAINLLEQALIIRNVAPDERIPEILRNRIAPMSIKMDDFGDLHYDITSAFIKSMRGSNPDATMHWLCRLMEGGVDPRYIARRIAIHASEDVGMADPTALVIANAALQAVEKIGYPECKLTLSQAALHVALAPKSPAVCNALSKAEADLKAGFQPAIPPYLQDNHYKGAAKLGVGGYDHPGAYPRGRHPEGQGHDYCPGIPASYWKPNENDPHV